MAKPAPSSEPRPPDVQKIVLGALILVFAVMFILWFSNFFLDKPILGFGEVEFFGRQAAPIAATAPMTWKLVPSLAPMAVAHTIAPPATASKIERLEQIEPGLFRVSYLSDSTVVYGLLGVPDKVPAPALVVCHPSDSPYTTGLHTRDTVKFLASNGVLAFAPDYRGWGPSGGQKGNEVRDVWNALASLRACPEARADRLGLIGFSMGGGVAARAAVADTGLALLILYYPQLLGTVEQLRAALRYGQVEPGSGQVAAVVDAGHRAQADAAEMEYVIRMISPIYHLRDFHGRVALFHGDKDEIVSPGQSDALYKELKAQGKDVSIKNYPELSHAFANSVENPSQADLLEVIKRFSAGQ